MWWGDNHRFDRGICVMGIDVNTIQEPDLHQFTEQQIEDFCVSVDNLPSGVHADDELFEAILIIRQLQSEVDKKVSRDLGADKYYD